MENQKETLCKKCQTEMKRDKLFDRKAFDTYIGTYNITDTSACTTVTTLPYDTSSMPVSAGVGHPIDDTKSKRSIIKIRNYTCPNCGWKTQIRE